MTRQHRYQLRHQALGLCVLCPRPVFAPSRWLCLTHLRVARVLKRVKARHHPWQAGKAGASPLERRG